MAKTNKKSDIKVVALGGLGEVGKNCYCIEYMDQIFVVDAGILFPDEHLLGVDYVIPDFSYLQENASRIVGLFITHGHEDHIGGIPYLLKVVPNIKIYASGVAIDLIQNKLSEFPHLRPTIVEYKAHSVFKFTGCDVSFVRLNHSVPDSHAIVFKTKEGTIIHTGDFKFDLTPIGPSAEFDKLTRLGSEGVLLLLADSTNAMVEGFNQSEKKVGDSITELFSQIKDRVIVATFASNIYRIQQIIEASVSNNRKVAVFGRSMEKAIEIGLQCGYIKAPKSTFIEPQELNSYKTSEITILCTGSQGEPMAALSRVANGSHRFIKLIPNDTVIFSSSPIPGNAEGVNRTINALFKNGVNVIVNSPITDTHTSGHAPQGDLKLMQTFIRPKFFMPIHGEYRMQKVHAGLAIECGCRKENTFVMENGDVLTLNHDKAYISDKIKADDIYIDGSRIGDVSSQLIRERKALSVDGMFAIIFTLNMKEKTIIGEPQVVSRGFIYMKDSEILTKHLIEVAKDTINAEIAKTKSININNLRSILTTSLSKQIISETDRNPSVIPVFMTI